MTAYLVRELALRQAPARLEVFFEVGGLLDASKDGGIDSLLLRGLGLWERLLLLRLAVGEELLLGGSRRRLGLLCKEGVGDLVGKL